MSSISVDTLSSGATVIVEPMSGVRSAAITWLTPCGDAFDPENRLGRAAMWSELLARGAGDFDSRAMADAFDRCGASRSIDNGRVFMRVSSSMLASRVNEALALVAKTVLQPRMDEASIEPTRDLCLQSLASLADDPQRRATLAARARHYPSPLNRSGYGDEAGLSALTRDELLTGWNESAKPGGSIIAVAGAVDRSAIVTEVERLLEGRTGKAAWFTKTDAAPRGYAHEDDDSEQVQIVLAHDAPKESADESLLERLLISVLSGGMSSRLFSEVREKRGLCYAVHAGYAGERETGIVTAYVGTTPDKAQEAIDVLHAELVAIGGSKPIEAEEFARAVAGFKSRLIFSGESTGSRAGSIASDYYRVGRPRSLDEMARLIDTVTLEDLNAYARERVLGTLTIQTLGKASVKPPA